MINPKQMRAVQEDWAARPLAERLATIKAFRHLVGKRAAWLASHIDFRPIADTLAAEILPLAEGAFFLQRRARSILGERRVSGMAPLWLPGMQASVRRIPWGLVLVIGPGNYPLFLPGIQALQALTAGNAVAIKPAPGGAESAAAFAELMREAGLPTGLLQILPESSGPEAVSAGFDHIVFTGSADTGRKVLRAAADQLTPCTMELSGCDAAFVLPGANIGLVAKSLAYSLRLNGGASCIAPRRVFVTPDDASFLEKALCAAASKIAPTPLPTRIVEQARPLLSSAKQAGARVVGFLAEMCPPILVFDANVEMDLLNADLFAPWLAVVVVRDTAEMLAADAACAYALGASVWGPLGEATEFTWRLRAPSICINDLIVPTADPRLPFGGRGRSGFGTTRGAEGLLAMTLPQAISKRVLPLRPHLVKPERMTARVLSTMASVLHADRGR